MMRDHFDAVWRSAKRLGLDAGRAEDVAQRAFMVAAEKLESIEIGKEKAYLLGVTTRLASDARKSVFYLRGRSLDTPNAPSYQARTSSPEDLVSRDQALRILDEALALLPDELRDVFVLSQVEEFTMQEISAMLEIPSGTVASRLRRARAAFGEALTQWVPMEDRASWMRMVAGEVFE